MTVRIDIDEVLFDVANKSHAEMLTAVPDPEERYRCEAGTEKRDEVLRCLETSLSRLDAALEGYTVGPHETTGDNLPRVGAGDAALYSFPPSERRYGTVAGALAGLMHSHLVNATLGLFYASVGRAENAELRAKLSAADLEGVLGAVRSKTRPVRAKPYTV